MSRKLLWLLLGFSIALTALMVGWQNIKYYPKDQEDLNLLTIENRSLHIRSILRPIETKIQDMYQIELPPVQLSLNLSPSGESSYGFIWATNRLIHLDLSWKLFVILNDEEIVAVIIHELGHIDMKNLVGNPMYYYHYSARDIDTEIKADLFTAQFIDPYIISSAITRLSYPGTEKERNERLEALALSH